MITNPEPYLKGPNCPFCQYLVAALCGVLEGNENE
jgi:hypothetical protein